MRARVLCRLGLTAVVVAAFLLFAMGSSDSGRGSSSSSSGSGSGTSGRSSSSFPQVGEEGKVYIAGLDTPLLAIDKSAFDQWVNVCAAGDEHGASQMHASGKMFGVKNGTRVKVIDIAFGALQVRVLEGDRTGKSGWISHEFVKRL